MQPFTLKTSLKKKVSRAIFLSFLLLLISFAGRANLPKMIPVKISKENQVASVSSNPFTSYVNVNVEWGKSEIITARVINIQGREVVAKTIQINKGAKYIRIDELSICLQETIPFSSFHQLKDLHKKSPSN